MNQLSNNVERNSILIYIGHLRIIEESLSMLSNETSPVNPEINTTIEKSFSYLMENFKKIITEEMSVERKEIFLFMILKIFIRIYIGRINNIVVQKDFQAMARRVGGVTKKFCYQTSKENNSHVKEIFYKLLSLLSDEDLMAKCLERVLLELNVSAESEGSPTTDGFDIFLENIFSCTSHLGSQIMIRSVEEFDKKYEPLLMSLFKFVHQILNSNKNYERIGSLMNLVSSILSFTSSLTDKTILVPTFVHIQCVETLVAWLNSATLNVIISDPSQSASCQKHHKYLLDVCFLTTLLIYNISREKLGLQKLHQVNAYDILLKWKTLFEETSRDDLKLNLGLCYIILHTSGKETVDENQLHWVMKRLYERSIMSAKTKDWNHDGFHLSELLVSLESIFSSATDLRVVVTQLRVSAEDPIQFFAKLMINTYGLFLHQEVDQVGQSIMRSLQKILLSISNYHEYRDALCQDERFSVLIESLAKRTRKDDIKRIWANLRPIVMITTDPLNTLKTTRKSMIYVSYHWKNLADCQEFIGQLRKLARIPVWVQYEQITKSSLVWEAIEPVIDSATQMIVLLTNTYCRSIYKQHELNYAVAKKKRLQKEFSITVLDFEENLNITHYLIEQALNELPKCLSYEKNMSLMAKAVTLQQVNPFFALTRPINQPSSVCTTM